MNVHIPPAIQDLSPVLSEFFDGMIHKLNVNSHKDAIRGDDIDGLLAKMADEIQEFRDQRLQDAADPNILSELADIGNFAFLLYAYLRHQGVMDLKERFIREFYTVDTATGRIFCAKTRSGSPLKVGEEVTGTERNGVTYIRAQHTASGATIYLARRDIVWWAEHGQWPVHPLHYNEAGYSAKFNYTDGLRTKDAVSNLVYGPIPGKKKYPYVSRYAPQGREGTKNWGKWVYQRRHKLRLIRVGYWDTEEEAAREGVQSWKEATRGI